MRTEGGFRVGVLTALLLTAILAGCPSGVWDMSKYRVVDSGTSGLAGVPCGTPSVQALTTKQSVNGSSVYVSVGSVTVSNDKENVYVVYAMADNWSLNKTYLHVGLSGTDYPGYGAGVNAPIPLSFDYRYEPNAPAAGNPNWSYIAVREYTFVVPFADLGLSPGDCTSTLYFFVNANVALLDDNGAVVGDRMTAWGGDTPGDQSPKWYSVLVYDLQCCEEDGDGEFRTQTQGGWGTGCNGGNPGCYRDAWFDVAFPNGLAIGCAGGYSITFTSSLAVENFLPVGGKAGVLKQDYVNPTGRTDGGVLAGQLAALALTLGFDAVDSEFGVSPSLLADQTICNTGTTCDGMTVRQVFDAGNAVLGGCDMTGLKASDISDCLTIVNENYTDGTVDLGYICAK